VRRLAALALAFGLACASGQAGPSPPAGPPPRWPPAPAQARILFEDSFPSPRRAPPQTSFWGRVWNAVVGLGDDRRDDPPLQRPFGIALGGDRLLVADPDLRTVLSVDWRAGTSEAVTCPSRDWILPMGVAAGEAGSIWVADAGAHALVEVAGGRCRSVGAGVLDRPTGVAVGAGRIYAVDTPRHEVIAFSPAGAPVARVGVRGEEDGQLNFPTALAVLADGTLLVVDALNFRVARFTADGRWLRSFGNPGDGGGAFGRPKAIAADAQGRIYVTDALNDVVVVFSPEGEFQLAFGGRGDGPGALTLPAGVAVGADRVFVADSFNRRVQIYQLLGERP
jgi:DNA-binding beta-propeller fold protein YncE